MTETLPRFLTTKEFADLIRVKERKVYDLVATGEVPHSRATGKLLFPSDAVLAWIERFGASVSSDADRPAVMLGSHDPLLEWAIRESGCGLACLFDGSLDGLDRFAQDEGVAAGLHVPNPQDKGWNTALIEERFGYRPVVLVEWARRARGLILPTGNPQGIKTIADLKGRRVVRRQDSAGSHILLLREMEAAGLSEEDVTFTEVVARDERDAAHAVFSGEADAALGLEMGATQSRLVFISICYERFDIVIGRKDFFEQPFQTLMTFARGELFGARAKALGGYDVTGLGTVHFNGY